MLVPSHSSPPLDEVARATSDGRWRKINSAEPNRTGFLYRIISVDWIGYLLVTGAIIFLEVGIQWGGSTYKWTSGQVRHFIEVDSSSHADSYAFLGSWCHHWWIRRIYDSFHLLGDVRERERCHAHVTVPVCSPFFALFLFLFLFWVSNLLFHGGRNRTQWGCCIIAFFTLYSNLMYVLSSWTPWADTDWFERTVALSFSHTFTKLSWDMMLPRSVACNHSQQYLADVFPIPVVWIRDP